jgi:short subunit dehydrogenase-like uncharacterized protein
MRYQTPPKLDKSSARGLAMRCISPQTFSMLIASLRALIACVTHYQVYTLPVIIVCLANQATLCDISGKSAD